MSAHTHTHFCLWMHSLPSRLSYVALLKCCPLGVNLWMEIRRSAACSHEAQLRAQQPEARFLPRQTTPPAGACRFHLLPTHTHTRSTLHPPRGALLCFVDSAKINLLWSHISYVRGYQDASRKANHCGLFFFLKMPAGSVWNELFSSMLCWEIKGLGLDWSYWIHWHKAFDREHVRWWLHICL